MEDNNHQVRSILMIDDDTDFLHVMERRMESVRSQYTTAPKVEVLTFTDPVEALVHIPPEGITILVIDYSMPDGTGLDWLPKLVKTGAGPVILLTNRNDATIAAEAFRAGAADFMSKADAVNDDQRLARCLREAVHRFRMETRNQSLTRELKLVNLELESKNKRLKELTDTAHHFVDDVAHDFRTPLTVIQQYVGLVTDGLSGPVNDMQLKHLGTITEATRELAEMVDDFLDSSKLRARALPMYRQHHTVEELFELVKPMVAVRAAPRQVAVEYQTRQEVPPFFGDLSKAGRVLTNLICNAIKVTPPAHPLHIWADSMPSGMVRVGVTDVGPGLKPEDVKVIFERFKQLDEPQPGDSHGFGLGLSIVKQLAWLNFGTVEVTSERGKGSTFAFTLPPHDISAILAAFLAIVRAGAEPANLWNLRITSPGAAADVSALRRVISTFCYPMDLILESPHHHAVNALGVSRDPQAWANRIRAEAARFHKSVMKEEARELEISVLGPWPRDVEAAKLASILSSPTAETSHV